MSSAISVLGAGSWGTALAIHLANHHVDLDVRLWGRDRTAMQAMQESRCNEKYLPQVSLPDNLMCYGDLTSAVDGVEDILVMVPSSGFAELLAQLTALPDAKIRRVAWGTKGLDAAAPGLQLLDQTVKQVFGNQVEMAVLSGPSFAKEVARGAPTAIVVASDSNAFLTDLVSLFHVGHFRLYTSRDMLGVQLSGVLKNVMAVAAGVADGLGLGANTRSALITRAIAEMMRLGEVLGAEAQTFMGLAGIGDLILTCTSDLSRNRRLGLAIGRGETIANAAASIGQVVESLDNVARVAEYASAQGVELPITQQVAEILDGKSPQQALTDLLSREPKSEWR